MGLSPFPPLVVCAVVVGLLLFTEPVHLANGWSGADAYTIVVLNRFDTDLDLQNKFYNAPNGTLLTIARSGYRLLEEHDPPSASAREEASMHTYALDEHLTTALAYQGINAIDAPLPFRCRLSGEWVVWNKERPRRRSGDGHPRWEDVEAEPLLLHCRLPLPQNRTLQALQQQRYIARNRAAMSSALEVWWHNVASEQSSRCLYGEGEKALTGTERYYELCPAGVVYRVQHQRLKHLLQQPSQHSNPKSKSAQNRDAPNLLEFLHAMHHSPSTRHAILQNSRYNGVFEVIGRYHPRLSKPRWNPEHLVWESVYPSMNPCGTHYTTLSDFNGTMKVKDSTAARVRRAPHTVQPQDAYWKTVVRFRCPPHRSSKETSKASLWTVTEARQLCEYHVEMMSELVCGWEQELDSFQVNPVPCVVVD
ncbi:hypothetical protein JKF63_00823 [Porcisia hertigi]|uniref:Uncharacterized protein n=1 Tax=Porcisia hertigi TaxID=2761500 RepID=A0A836KXE9_9TRYP|nr:hypothetical protein JKF63_00823 [Porcisia hertigi]